MAGDIDVLVVDSDQDRRLETVEALSGSERLTVFSAATVAEAERLIDEEEIECVVAAHRLDDGLSVDVFRAASDHQPYFSEVGRIIFDDVNREGLLPVQLELIYAFIDSSEEDAAEELRDTIVSGYDQGAFAPYPVPMDEEERLSVIEDLKLEATDALDRLVENAADHFEVPYASIRIIEEDTQQYLVTCGFEADTLPREESVCTYTIMDPHGTLVIEDLQEDPRWEDVQFYRDKGINWYAGTPIIVDEEPIGTFCLEAGENQEFTERDRRELQEFADHAATLLTARHEMDEASSGSVEDVVRAAEKRSDHGG